MSKEEMVQLENVTEGATGPRMAREKYEIYKRVILATVPRSDKGILLKVLIEEVRRRLPQEKRAMLGQVTWHVMSVKLDLEARGLITRIAGRTPQALRRMR